MKIILLISKNSQKTDSIAKYNPLNLDLVVVRNKKYAKHHLEEYIPDYIIVNNPLKNLYKKTEYSIKNPITTIFLCNLKKYCQEPNPDFIFTKNSNLKNNIREIIAAIQGNKLNYRFSGL